METSVSFPRPRIRMFAPATDRAPHLATWVDTLWHVRVLPTWPLWALWEVASVQATANALPTILVKDRGTAIRFDPDGRLSVDAIAPTHGRIIVDRLLLADEIPLDEEAETRRAALAEGAVQEPAFEPCPWMGGHMAGPPEIERLAGERDGIPRGLERCPTCGELTGECLRAAGKGPAVVPVLCRCHPPGRCARCGEPFHARRVGSAWFDEAAGEVRYVPALLALRHVCPERE